MNPQPDMSLVARTYPTRGPTRPWSEVFPEWAAMHGETIGVFTADPDPVDLEDDVA